MRYIGLLIVCLCVCTAQAQLLNDGSEKTSYFQHLKHIRNSSIPGAPILSDAKRIDGKKFEIRTEKQGLIYPAVYDWNKDGLEDLLLGEFEVADKGSNVKVYLNTGSEKKPKYTGEFQYATDINGDTITCNQWCCMGIHPRIVDLNLDGYLDIVSGHFSPGRISWWKGSEKGFLSEQYLEQEGFPESHEDITSRNPISPKSDTYWTYTSAHFADANHDGLPDLFVGGYGGMRLALNIGTKEKPKFGIRKLLYHVDGSPLEIYHDQETIDRNKEYGLFTNPAGVQKTYLTPVDWDNDGVTDLLVTHEYTKKGHYPISFFRGIETDKGLRFDKMKPLFVGKKADKILPGCQPMINVTDYNQDGVNDIVMGLSVPTINRYQVANEICWKWIDDIKIRMPGKDIGQKIRNQQDFEKAIKKIESDSSGFTRNQYLATLTNYKYLTLRHRGYAFVFYGKANKEKAQAIKQKAAKIVEPIVPVKKKSDKQVECIVNSPEILQIDQEAEVIIDLHLQQGLYLYANTKANQKAGYIPTTVSFQLPEQLEAIGEVMNPKVIDHGGVDVYMGNSISFTQKLKLKSIPNNADGVGVKVTINYQACNKGMCFPPKTIDRYVEFKLKK
jgi:hypothetical protein